MSPFVNNKAVIWSCQIERAKIADHAASAGEEMKTVREHGLRIDRQGAGQCHSAAILP
jgi:hypothetical protein